MRVIYQTSMRECSFMEMLDENSINIYQNGHLVFLLRKVPKELCFNILNTSAVNGWIDLNKFSNGIDITYNRYTG